MSGQIVVDEAIKPAEIREQQPEWIVPEKRGGRVLEGDRGDKDLPGPRLLAPAKFTDPQGRQATFGCGLLATMAD